MATKSNGFVVLEVIDEDGCLEKIIFIFLVSLVFTVIKALPNPKH